jgi:hypothetical protein
VQDHYTAWRQTQDQPQRRHGSDGPFSFCSYPFLLDPRAKSNLLHIEARFQMEQVMLQFITNCKRLLCLRQLPHMVVATLQHCCCNVLCGCHIPGAATLQQLLLILLECASLA